MRDNTKILSELMELTETPEQVLFLKELDSELIVLREEERRKLEAEIHVTKKVYDNVIGNIVDRLNRVY